MPLTQFAVDEGAHTMDGLLLHARDGSTPVEAFISRRVNLKAIGRVVASKCRGGLDLNRQHPFVDILFADIVQSGETLDLGDCLTDAMR